MQTIADIIRAAGGRAAVNARVGKRDAARKWETIGIPDRYWPAIQSMVPDLTAEQLAAANEATRARAYPSAAAE